MQVARHISQTEASALHFTDFSISQSLKDRLTAAGFIKPTPVQAGAIPRRSKAMTFLPRPRPEPARH